MARMPSGVPRSVPDVDGEAYEEMLRKERWAQDAAAPSVGHPGFAESLVPIWGSGREAVADFQEGDYLGAGLNGALAASDLFLAGSIAKGLAKGGFYVARGAAKEVANPYHWKNYVRPWLGKQRYLKAGQHGHHWAIPQKSWGKAIPDMIKNQPWNIKPMRDAVSHWRIEHRVGELPRFNPIERYWQGTPAWSKVGSASAVGHPVAADKARREHQ